MHAISPDRASAVLKEAIAEAKQSDWTSIWQSSVFAQVAKAAAHIGAYQTAVELLQSPDATPGENIWNRQEIADAWKRAGKPETARQVLREVLDFPPTEEHASNLDHAAEELVRLGEPDVARRLPRYTGDEARLRDLFNVARVRAYAVAGDLDEAQKIAGQISEQYRSPASTAIAMSDFTRHRDPSRTQTTAAIRADGAMGEHSEFLVAVIGDLVRQKRDREVEQLIAEVSTKYDGQATVRALFVKQLIGVGRLDDAARAAEPLKSDERPDVQRPLAFARLGRAFAHVGRRTEAENALRYAESRLPALLGEHDRDHINAVRASAEAHLGRFRKARLIADGIESDEWQWEAYFGILEVYAKQEKNR